jgi:hypothetical protein
VPERGESREEAWRARADDRATSCGEEWDVANAANDGKGTATC